MERIDTGPRRTSGKEASRKRGRQRRLGGKMAVEHVSEEVKSMVPGGPDPDGMEKNKQDGRVRAGRRRPVNQVRGKREDTEGSGRPGCRCDDEGQVRMQELSLMLRPQPARL